MRCAIYVRVSTEKQNYELQKDELTRYAEARGWEITLFEEKDSGTIANRPALQTLLKASRRRIIDVVLVWKLDRFFRSTRDALNTLQELDELGVKFISLKDNLDLTTASGRLMMQMIAAFAEFEASLIRERVKAGLAHAKKNGTRSGKPIGRPMMRDDAAIQALRAKNLSIRAIAKQLGCSAGAVQSTLRTANKAN